MKEGQIKPMAIMDGQGFKKKCDQHIVNAKEYKNSLLKASNQDSKWLLNIYNNILIEISSVEAQANLLSETHHDEKIRKEAESCELEISKFITDLSLDKKIFNILSSVNQLSLDEKAERMLKNTLRDFRRSGVDKDDATQNKIKTLKEDIVRLGQEFGQNIRKDRLVIELDSKEDLLGLPEDYIKSHQPNKNGKIEISTDYPDYVPFMKYAKSEHFRKELRYKNLNRGKDNDRVLKNLIEKRHELAKLLGYGSYADYVAEDKMIKEAKHIHEFIEKISGLAKDGADKEHKELLAFKKQSEKDAKDIEGYESAYIEEAYKKSKFNFDSQEARNYFSYPKVRDGLLKTTAKLFGLSYQKVDNLNVWHPSVEVYDISDETGKIGRIYLDMHPREGKYKHAAMFSIVNGLKNRQYPEGALVCNFRAPTDSDPHALMEHREVVTFFHEFGHLLHHIFAGKEEYPQFSGIATEWDFVEAPSQFLEEWAWSLEVLKTFAHHYKTHQPIPELLVKKMRAAEEFGKAIAIRQQMFYAALSVNYYDQNPKKIDLLETLKDMQKKYSYYPYEHDTHFYKNFGHLDDYSAVYYTYAWSLSIAKDLLTPFKEKGLMDQTLARKYRNTILNPGGSKDAKDLIVDFLGRPFKFDAFKKWLKKDS